ncbi:replication factor C subunit 4 [Sitodiplosis mosellana]|uniref:replication factor C subunit 4 n=1 Tax=Sitodiplosis mosellana TaxID=263140 RepID=UPI002443AAD9|nr:replication factor C subunit 4 [Sitodiplosis mosellana]
MQAYLKTGKVGGGFAKPSTSSGKESEINAKKIVPWVEKYRPKKVDDVVEQKEVVAVLKDSLTGADLPNLLLYGPPGTGKTSTILAASRQLFGDIYKERILELNASDQRGIDVIRTKVKNFAQLTASSVRPDGKPCPPFKIIILDEADSMTHAAQAALRRTMEKESKTTRFCLVCNYVSRIIEPITSRCTKFRFKALARDKIIERLQYICREENVAIDNDVFDIIVDISDGDMRRAITTLQSCFRLKVGQGNVTKTDIFEMSGLIPDKYLSDFLEVCKKGDYSKLEAYVQDIQYEAYSIAQFFEQFNDYVITSKALTCKQKAAICDKLGECCFRMQEGGSEYLQIMDLGCNIIRTVQA